MLRIALMLAVYAAFLYWGCRKLGSMGRLKEIALFAPLTAYCAVITTAAMESWTAPTPTRLSEAIFLPMGKWLFSHLQGL